VTATDVAEAVKNQIGIELDRHDIDLEPIKHLGMHEVRISLHPEVTAEVTVEVAEAVQA
jgi:large subunit ribosomal protein L9